MVKGKSHFPKVFDKPLASSKVPFKIPLHGPCVELEIEKLNLRSPLLLTCALRVFFIVILSTTRLHPRSRIT